MKRLILICIAAAVLGGVGLSARASDKSADASVAQFYDELEKVMNAPDLAKNPSMIFPFFDDDMHMFDIMLPETFVGAAFRKHFTELAGAFPGKTTFVDMKIHTAQDMAFATYIQDFTGQMNGAPVAMRIRTTDALVRKNGKWVIVHEHVSLPLDGQTMAALMTKKSCCAE